MEDTKDCPLCGEKDAIKCVPIATRTRTIPAPKGTVGNYHIEHSGGGYDYSHALVCKELKNAFKKEALLEFYTQGSSGFTYADLHSYEDYQDFFARNGFDLKVDCKRKEGTFSKMNWYFEAYLAPRLSNEKYLISEGKIPEVAFGILIYRLLCGDLIKISENEALQLISSGKGKLNLVHI